MNNLYTLLLLLPLQSFSQSLTQTIDQQINAARVGQAGQVMVLSGYGNGELRQGLNRLETYMGDSSVQVRARAYDIVFQIGQFASDEEVAGESLVLFFNGMQDADRGIAGFVVQRLSTFPRGLFSAAQRENLVSRLSARPFYLEDLMLLLAYLEESAAIGPMIELLQLYSPEMTQMQRWQAHIALARLGEIPALDFIVRKTRELPSNDDMVYEIYPTLVFTRQKAAIDVLVNLVFEESANCSSPDPDVNRPITCAYRILELIAPVIQNFPIAVDTLSGDLDTNDYPAALAQARTWLSANRKTYQLVGE